MRQIAIQVVDRMTELLQRLAVLSRGQKQLIVFFVDLMLLLQSIWIAYSLRVGEWILWDLGASRLTIGAVILMVPTFYFSGVYRTIFRYVGLGMLRTLVRAALYYAVAMAFVYTVISVPEVPRTAGIMQPIIFLGFVTAARVMARFLMVDVLHRTHFDGEKRKVLVYGAGDAGQQAVNAIASAPEMQVIGYLDDDKRLAGQRLDGVKVYWAGNLPGVIKMTLADDVLLALPGATRKRRRAIVQALGDLKVGVKTLPQMKDIAAGNVAVTDIRPLEIEDLLGREPVAPNELLLGRTTVGKVLMVTGAGGSIGSELCRQIAKLKARKLVLFEVSEFALYSIHRELETFTREERLGDIEIVPVLGSVCDEQRINEVIAAHRVETIYHAAAYKHVPLVEANPLEAIRNNIVGTYTMVRAAQAAKVKDFILISTDKAVRPTNVMGATKRAAEQILQGYAERDGDTRFSMVRFGNVLGSSGSVVPLFRQQIELGGPITLTDKDVTRYFMTIPEAALLVIQAAGMAKGGEVFVLDMGKPVRIADLAATMVQLSGLSVRDDDNPDG
ncbi:MAG: nucleoside-diphosphate sugar epimerase/dehydratase, partial [Pseudomonadota bacterium]